MGSGEPSQSESIAQAHYHTVLSLVGDAVVLTDVHGCIDFINPAAERLTGWTETEAQGKPLDELLRLVDAETRSDVECPVMWLLRGGVASEVARQVSLIARSGEERPIAYNGVPVRDHEGKIAGAALVFRHAVSVSEGRTVERGPRQYDRNLRFLYDVSSALNSLAREDSIEEYVARALREHLGARLVLVSRYLPERQVLTTRHVEADSGLLRAAVSILKANLIGFESNVDAASLSRMLNERVAVLHDSHEASFGAVPRAVSAVLNKVLGLEKFVALALVCRSRLWGTVMSVLPVGAAVPDEESLGTVAEVIAQAMQRRDSEAREAHLNNVLLAIRNLNQLMVRVGDSQKLVQQACNLLVETRGYKGAWIALPLDDGQLGALVGAGWGEEFETFALRVRGGLRPPCWAKARGAENGLTVLDREKDCAGCMLRGDCADNSAVVVRLAHGNKLIGFLGIAAPPEIVINEEERSLILEVSGDIAFALNAIERGRLWKATNKQFEAGFDKGAVGQALTSLDGRFLRVNGALTRLLGYEANDLEGKTVSSVTHPDEQLVAGSAVEAIPAGRGTSRFEKRLVARNGDTIWVDVNVALVCEDNGQPRYFISTFVDITDRKRHELAFREIERRYKTIFEGGAQGILVADIETKRFVQVNPAICNMLGYAEQELTGLRVEDIHPKESLDQVMAAFAAHARRETVIAPSLPCLRKDGTVFYADVAATPVVMNGRKCNVGFFLDVTYRRRAEEERAELQEHLRASQKMESIGQLAGGVAHDFNNLLAVILSYTEFAMKETREGDPLRNDLLEVQKAADRAAALTRQLLAFSRKQVLRPVPLSLNQTTAGLEKMLRRIIGEDIDLVLTPAQDLGLTLADPGQIEQVIMNLVVNARDAMPEGGKLSIETSNVEVDEEYAARHVAVTPGSYVQLAVTDTGRGMDEQTKSRIFEPFFTTKAKGKGTGLGLSTVYGIVKQSGGNIWVYSEVGQGTTFKIYLPRESSAVAAVTTAPAATRPTTGTETILVVEDEEALRKVAKRSLEAAGYTVLAAADGDEALQVAAQHAGTIHLLLTDVVMPRMSGRALAQELAKSRPTLKVVYTSGYTDNAIVHHGVLDAGTHFIGKPSTGAALTCKVREVLDAGTNKPDGT
jgi:PAS domain S-box-containing protein